MLECFPCSPSPMTALLLPAKSDTSFTAALEHNTPTIQGQNDAGPSIIFQQGTRADFRCPPDVLLV